MIFSFLASSDDIFWLFGLVFLPLVGSDGRNFGMVEYCSMIWGSVKEGMDLGGVVDLGGEVDLGGVVDLIGVVDLSGVVDLGGMVYLDLGGTVVWF